MLLDFGVLDKSSPVRSFFPRLWLGLELLILAENLNAELFFFDRDQEAILSDLRVDLALQFDFLFSATHVEVISGKQEGIYSWIAVNHVLGKFDHFLHSGCNIILL